MGQSSNGPISVQPVAKAKGRTYLFWINDVTGTWGKTDMAHTALDYPLWKCSSCPEVYGQDWIKWRGKLLSDQQRSGKRVEKLNGTQLRDLPDSIETEKYLVAAAITGRLNLKIPRCQPVANAFFAYTEERGLKSNLWDESRGYEGKRPKL